jgi:phage-related minor tail protein
MEVNIIRDVINTDKAIVVDFSGDVIRGTKKLNTRFTATATDSDSIKDSLVATNTIKDSLKGF